MKFMKLGSKPDCFRSEGKRVRIIGTDLASDIVVGVGDKEFYLHKFPILSKSFRLQRLVEASEGDVKEIFLPDIPGGAAAFEVCAKFCYGMTVTLNAHNVVAARCAAEYLEMHESVEKSNLSYKIDVFLNTSIFRSWKDSIIVLQTMNSYLPWSEDLELISRCIDSIASKASVEASKVDWSYTYNRKILESSREAHENGVRKPSTVPKDWWAEDLTDLEMDHYKDVIAAIKCKGRVSAEAVGEAIKTYLYNKLPAINNVLPSSGDGEIQALIESIVWLLPVEKGSVSCSFLLKLLRAASLLECGDVCIKELVKRAGRQLEEASVQDLLIPVVNGECTTYDVDMILNIVLEFVMQVDKGNQSNEEITEDIQEMKGGAVADAASVVAVGTLVDGYLAEVAKDPNLPLSKFVDLAEMLPKDSRPGHDGLYRAIDIYLKEHPALGKVEKRHLCSLLDCKKLTQDACAHAVQNERLPVRLIVQILFYDRAHAPGPATTRADSIRIGSYGSSRSGGTVNTEDEWEGIPATEDLGSSKSTNIAEIKPDATDNGFDNGKAKPATVPKKAAGKSLRTRSSGSCEAQK